MIKFFLIYITLLSNILFASDIKNVFIFVEPTSIVNSIDEKGKKTNDILKASERITRDIVKAAKSNKIKRIILSDGLDAKPSELRKKEKINRFVKRFYKKNLYKKHNYKIEKLLGRLHTYFDEKLTAKNTMLVYIGDVNFMRGRVNSHGGYLNSAWLINKNSVFLKKFLNQDNTNLKDMPVFIINRTQLPLQHEKKRDDFIVKMFELAGMNTCFIANNSRNFASSVKVNYIADAFEAQLKNTSIIKSKLTLESYNCQIVNPVEYPVSGCGSNVE